MKRMDIFCASPASTAICSSMDKRSVVQPGTRTIDRYNPRLRDGNRITRTLTPCPSYPSTKPKHYHHQNTRNSSANITDLTGPSPPGSTRYLLSNRAFFDVLPDFDPYSALVPVESSKPPACVTSTESPALKHTSSTRATNQVVVLKVSLHCRGCEGKVRKHISRMEGVTSFSIDFANKKVTLIGDITPLEVLASVSRVKNAQFWPSSAAAPAPVPLGLAY